MKNIVTLTLGACAAALALQAQAQPQGQEMGRVLSATPVMQQVAVPQQICGNDAYYGQRPTSGAGAVIGAIAGGILGHTVGGGGGQALATGIGAIGGAIVGDNLEGGQGGYQSAQRCITQTRYDNQVVGYDVVYEYAGRQYSVRTQADPGQWIPLSVQPAAQAPVYQPDYGAPQNYGYGYGTVQPGVVVTNAPMVVSPAIGATIQYRGGSGWQRGYGHHYWR